MSPLTLALGPHEQRLVGAWQAGPRGLNADATCARIEQLMRSHLVRLASDDSGWNVLYKDPTDGRLWELTYASSESHGGGPPTLTVIASTEAKRKYASVSDI